MRISKQLRDDAATICAACASEPTFYGASRATAAFEFNFAAVRLACHAWAKAGGYAGEPIAYAEAEALLRTGWTP